LTLRSNTTPKISLQADGDLFIGTDAGSASTITFAIFTNAQTYNGESVGAGDLLMGSNSASKANVLWDSSAGQLLFRGGTTTQLYIDTTGNLVAGDDVILNASGLSISVPNAFSVGSDDEIKFTSGGSQVSGISGRADIGAGGTKFNEMRAYVDEYTAGGALAASWKLVSSLNFTGMQIVGALTADDHFEIAEDIRYGNLGAHPSVGTSSVQTYRKGNFFVIHAEDGIGGNKYFYLNITGTSATWTYSTTAP